MGNIQGFVAEVRAELDKVAWPTKRELWASTRVVLLWTGLLAVFIGVCDFFASQVVRLIIR